MAKDINYPVIEEAFMDTRKNSTCQLKGKQQQIILN